ncbi:hypothetical protein PUN71_007455 [Arthrobacter sp. NQ7]|nr:hypothetical protein [Arthrobacter sp. NQ7]MDJ0457030.1 hypothetical protein [Arthrobacter sp. NQ7]
MAKYAAATTALAADTSHHHSKHVSFATLDETRTVHVQPIT